MSKARGSLIMFDGPDGVGKTTQFDLAARQLLAAGHDVYSTHLLGGTSIGEALRGVMFSNDSRPPLTNLHLSLAIYYALAEDLAARRAAGTTILVDRSPLSLIAYQVHGDGLDETSGYRACDEALDAFQPDALIVYEAPLKMLSERRSARHKAGDYFEAQQLEYHRRTTEGYGVAARKYGATLVDASGSIEAVHSRTMELLATLGI